MSTNFPTSLDSYTNRTNGQTIDASHVDNLQDAVEAVEAKVGIDGSAVTSSLDYKVTNTSSINPGHKHTLAAGISDVTISTPTNGQFLQYNGTTWENAAAGDVGEANTASNVGTAGVGVFKQKSGVDLQFKKINAGSSKITITDDTGNDEVDIDVAEANLTLGNLGGTLALNKGGTGQTTQTAAFDALAPTTTKGDIIVSNGSDNVRLAVGATNGHVLQVDSAETTGVKWGLTPGIKTRFMTTPVTVTNTGSETTIDSFTLSGGTLSTGNAIHFKAIISDFDIAGSEGLYFFLKYGGSTIGSIQIPNNDVSGKTNLRGFVEGYVVANGATNAQIGYILATLNRQNLDTNIGDGATQVDTQSSAVDSTSNQTLSLSVEWLNPDVSNSVTIPLVVWTKITV